MAVGTLTRGCRIRRATVSRPKSSIPPLGWSCAITPDFDYKRACFAAYNRWLTAYCEPYPERLIGIGQTAVRTPEEAVADLHEIKKLGLHGVMLPGDPAVEDYDSAVYDPLWRTAIELELPLSFHILTNRDNAMFSGRSRGPRLNAFLAVIRGCQDIMGMLILGGVFERHPQLKIVCVEADAGWVPHYMYRMDHAYERHRHWLPAGQELSRLPSEYFRENIYTTFQDDWVAFKTADLVNSDHLMWANDFPHSDSTWPNSQALLAEHRSHLSASQAERIISANVAELYGIDRSVLG